MLIDKPLKNPVKENPWHLYRNKDLTWAVAEALMYLEEDISFAATPLPVRQQPNANRYFKDAQYLIKVTLLTLEKENKDGVISNWYQINNRKN